MPNKDRLLSVYETAIKWCVMAIIFAAPFSKSISEIAITVGIVLWLLVKVMSGRFDIKPNPLAIPFLIFVLFILPSFFNTAFMALSMKALITKNIKYVLLYFVITESIDTKEKLMDIFIISLLAMVVITIDGFGQYYYSGVDALHYPGYPSFKYRPASDLDAGFFRGFPTACFPYPNDLAAWILLTVFPLACVTIFGNIRAWVKIATSIISVGMMGLFTLAKTRGAWIGLCISTLYIALSKHKIWLILILVLLLAIPYILKMEMASYLFNIGSFSDRVSMWGTSWEIFAKHPFIGNGINTFFVNFMKYRNDEFKGKKGSYAHNCYLQMAGDAGILGLSGFLWLMIAYFRAIIRGLRRVSNPVFRSAAWGISIGIFAFLVHSFFDTNLYSLNLVTLFWANIAVSMSIIKVCGADK